MTTDASARPPIAIPAGSKDSDGPIGTQMLPAARRGTWTFLYGGGARAVRHVHLSTDVDATQMVARRDTAGYTAQVVHAAAQVGVGRAAMRTLLRRTPLGPRLTVLEDVSVKLPVDRTVQGVRCVLPCLVPAAQTLSAGQIQEILDQHRDSPLDASGPFADALRLQRLPLPVYRAVYGLAMARTQLRSRIQGTFSVTSVGQSDVTLIHPLISGTFGFGIGRVRTAPAVTDGLVVARPMVTLTLAFDHRVVDGAEAASILSAVKSFLESDPS